MAPWLVWNSGNPRDPILVAEPPVWNDGLEALPSSEVLEAVRGSVGPRPAERLPFFEMLTDEMGGVPEHGHPTTLEEIDGELLGLTLRHRTFRAPDLPRTGGSTHRRGERLNLLFRMAREVEGE
jgi:hypothetical protein